MLDEDTIKQIQKMRENGASINRIAHELQISRPTIRKYLSPTGDDPEAEQFDPTPEPEQRVGHIYPSTKKKVPEIHPKVAEAKANAEVLGWKIEEEKNKQKLEEVTGPKEHPALAKKKAKVEIAKLDVDQYEAKKRLQELKEEEKKKAQAEEEAKLEKERERKRIEEEQKRAEAHEKWIQEYQDQALSWWLPWGLSIPSTLKFEIKDAIAKVLKNRSQSEDSYEIERLLKETVNAIIEPYLKEQEEKRRIEESKRRETKKVQLIQSALSEVDDYIRAQGLEAYVDQQTREKVKEYIREHFMKTLTGNERFIPSYDIREVLDSVFKNLKEKVTKEKEAEEAKARKERKIEALIQVGMERMNFYIVKNYDDLQPLNNKEEEEAKEYLQKELREEIEGDESRQEVEKLTDECLDIFFFED
jgi:hypothetical protein